jgi:transcriptional regulator GlxA family with amidase domain
MRAILVRFIVASLVAASDVATGARAATPARDYACPPCGCPGDSLFQEKPGTCRVCGMELVRRSLIRKVAILVFEGVEPLDFAGPAEVFGATLGGFEVYTVGKSRSPVEASMGGFSVRPAYGFKDCPPPQILVVPGGAVGGVERDPEVLAWLRRTAQGAEIVMSVCSGAFVLGKAGLLDGLQATAHPEDVDELRRATPRARVVAGRRYVDNGKVITAGGVSAGIDAALHVVERLLGRERATRVAAHIQHARRGP